MLDTRPNGCGFEPNRGHCLVSLSMNINPSLVLVQPRKTCHFLTERLLMGRKESNQTKKQANTLDIFLVDRSVKYLRYVFVNRSVKYLRYVFVEA